MLHVVEGHQLQRVVAYSRHELLQLLDLRQERRNVPDHGNGRLLRPVHVHELLRGIHWLGLPDEGVREQLQLQWALHGTVQLQLLPWVHGGVVQRLVQMRRPWGVRSGDRQRGADVRV